MSGATVRIALVTGANKGIGFEVARQLGRHGCTVLVGARDLDRGAKAVARLRDEGVQAHLVELDLDRPDTIRAAARVIKQDFCRLDILVNNAGIADAGDGPPDEAKVDSVLHVLNTNFVGALRVAQAMLPLLRESRAGRIVNVSSSAGSLALHGDPSWAFAKWSNLGYDSSKAALNMLTVELAYELRDTPIKVNSADPGYTATDLNHNSGYQTVKEGAIEVVRLALLPPDGPSGGFFSSAGRIPW